MVLSHYSSENSYKQWSDNLRATSRHTRAHSTLFDTCEVVLCLYMQCVCMRMHVIVSEWEWHVECIHVFQLVGSCIQKELKTYVVTFLTITCERNILDMSLLLSWSKRFSEHALWFLTCKVIWDISYFFKKTVPLLLGFNICWQNNLNLRRFMHWAPSTLNLVPKRKLFIVQYAFVFYLSYCNAVTWSNLGTWTNFAIHSFCKSFISV